jgi:ribosome biogenesis GTPase
MTSQAGKPDTQLVESRVVECFGQRVVVVTASGERSVARLFGRRVSTVCGDRVLVRCAQTEPEKLVVEVLPRATLFARTDTRGRTEPLAANISRLLVLLASEPECDLFIADRYLAGAALAGIDAAIVVNKTDLASARTDVFAGAIREYREAGYAMFEVSAHDRSGLDVLASTLRDQTAMLVGQSGVGKSTLTNALVPESSRPTRELSGATGEGRHTTVSAALFPLPHGGELIDTPGVRDYAPAPVSDAEIQYGWPEVARLAPGCRFNDCLHLREPGCAVIAAVESNEIAARRYESYRRLINVMRSLLPKHERRPFSRT